MDAQHPIPQQISSYQFRLVGDMTLKQFFQLAGGALVSLLIYATGLHPIIKWPLIIFFFSLGAALAFLPFEERPLSNWIFSFFRSVYSPTVYYWKRAAKTYQFFKEEVPEGQKTATATQTETAIQSYLTNLPDQKLGFLSRLEDAEKSLLDKVTNLFNTTAAPVPIQTPLASPKRETTVQKPPLPSVQPLRTPKQTPIQIAQKGFRPKIIIEESPLTEEAQKQLYQEAAVTPTIKPQEVTTQEAQFSFEASPPYPATIPNTIVGQVVDENGKIIEGAILEIKDMAGRPARALRSNKVGHFMIVTSLQDGTYSITTDKEGYLFNPLSFEAKGEIIQPILIRGQSNMNQEAGIRNQVTN